MKQAIDHVISAAMRHPNDQLNVLYLGYNGLIDSLLGDYGINYYVLDNTQQYSSNIELPKHFTRLPRGINYIPNRIDLHAIIVNSRYTHLNSAASIASAYHLPLILVDHELPKNDVSIKSRRFINSQLPKISAHVVPHDIVGSEWGLNNTYCIPYDIKVSVDNIKRKTVDLLVVGSDNVPSDNRYIREFVNSEANSVYVGRNGEYNNPYKSIVDMSARMSESYITVALQADHQPPILPLLAMSNRSVVITNKTRWTSAIIQDGVNGYLFDSIENAKKMIRYLLSHKDTLRGIEKNAFEMLQPVANTNSQELWLKLIRTLAEKVYIR